MNAPKTYKGVVREIQSSSQGVQEFFHPVCELVEKFGYRVSLAYVFSRLEDGQNQALYGGLRKLYAIEKDIAWSAIDSERIERSFFRDMYKTIFGREIPKDIVDTVREAEVVRDKIMHGKGAKESELRGAIVNAIKYAERLNNLTHSIAEFRPFAGMRGFTGRKKSLDKKTGTLVVKGLGFKL